MNAPAIYLCALVISAIVIAVLAVRSDNKGRYYRNECWKIAQQMRREWNTYPREKQVACALWLGRLGLRSPKIAVA